MQPTKTHPPLSLADYIAEYFDGIQVVFAKAQGVQKAQVSQWIKKGFIVVNHELYAPRRKLEH